MYRAMVWTTFGIEGTHSYPMAASDVQLQPVSYLASTHQHYFSFKVAVQVFENDREIEFQMLRRWLLSTYTTEPVDFGNASCEQLATDLHVKIAVKYPGRAVTIEVSEDGVCGAVLEFEATQAPA